MTRFLLLLALAGCPGKGPVDPTYTPAGPKPCEKMADHIVGLMTPKDPQTGKPVDAHRETADKITKVLIDTCTNDKWTQDAQKCWQSLSTIKDVEKCSPMMTVEQRDNFGKAMGAVLGGPPPAQPDGAGSGSGEPQ